MADPIITEKEEPIVEEPQVVSQGKTFTQEDVDRIVAERLARDRKGKPSDEEINEFRAWKTQKQTDAEKMAELSNSLSETRREMDDITKERDNAFKERDNAAKDKDRYKSERDKLKTDYTALNSRLGEMESKLTQYERERFLLAKGIPEKDLDYYVFKIGKEVTDENPFEKAAEAFLKDFDGAPVAKMDTGADLSGGAPAQTANERMNEIFRKARRM